MLLMALPNVAIVYCFLDILINSFLLFKLFFNLKYPPSSLCSFRQWALKHLSYRQDNHILCDPLYSLLYFYKKFLCLYHNTFFFLQLPSLYSFKISPGLLRYNWQITLYIVKVYNVMTWYTYTLWKDSHNQINEHIHHLI